MIHHSIPSIILYLQTNFGRITDQELSDNEDEVKTCSYDLSRPVDSIPCTTENGLSKIT